MRWAVSIEVSISLLLFCFLYSFDLRFLHRRVGLGSRTPSNQEKLLISSFVSIMNLMSNLLYAAAQSIVPTEAEISIRVGINELNDAWILPTLFNFNKAMRPTTSHFDFL